MHRLAFPYAELRPASVLVTLALFAGIFFPSIASILAGDLPEAVQGIDTNVLSDEQRQQQRGMVSRDIERRRVAAIQRENAAWTKVKTRADWEPFRDARLAALQSSLGRFPEAPPDAKKDLNVEVTDRIEGDGYVMENLVFTSRPGLLVTGNLYRPARAGKPRSRPGILISHSHHAPKTQGELQDMGMTCSAGLTWLGPRNFKNAATQAI